MVAKFVHVVAFAYKGYRCVFESCPRSPGLGCEVKRIAGFCGNSKGCTYRKVVFAAVAAVCGDSGNSLSRFTGSLHKHVADFEVMAFLYGVDSSGARSVVRKNGYFHYMVKPVFVLSYRRTFVQNFLRKVGGGNGNTVRNVGELVGKRADNAVILFPVDSKHFTSV
jgi:hypothetical protein